MGKKRLVERSCISCGRKAEKNNMLRFVAQEKGHIFFDLRQQRPGRGGYLCPREGCFINAAKKRRFAMRLKADVDFEPTVILKDVHEKIRLEIKTYEAFCRNSSLKKQTVLEGLSLVDLQIILSALKSQYSTICRG